MAAAQDPLKEKEGAPMGPLRFDRRVETVLKPKISLSTTLVAVAQDPLEEEEGAPMVPSEI